MSTLICGSIAFDSIMVFHDRFRNHILPEQIHILNVSFLVPELRREFGGCAGNIAYNLKLLGGDPLIMATVGDDAGPYLERLDRLGLARTHVTQVPGTFTAQAFITTDLDDNQITAFHPGAMVHSHRNKVEHTRGVTLGIVSPDGRDGMLEHVPASWRKQASPSSSTRARACPCSMAKNSLVACNWRTTARSTTTRPACCASAPDAASNPSLAKSGP
jgi:hypothetical protein